MRHYKRIENGYITMIGTGCGDIEISKAEYEDIVSVFVAKPVPPEGYDYRLTETLEWEPYELPHVDSDDIEISSDEALSIILGGG